MNLSKRTVFFIEWDEKFARFLKGVTLSPSLRGTVAIHIFYSQDIRQNILPPYKPWIFKHPALAEETCKIMESYVLRFNFDSNYSLTKAKGRSGLHRSREKGNPNSNLDGCYILSSSEKRSEVLARKVYNDLGVRLHVIGDVEGSNLLDFLSYKCDICKIAFKEKGELQQHDQAVHSLTCLNVECHHNKKKNAFKSETDFQQHVSRQLRCEFCPTKVFCVALVLDRHMKNTHKQCSCGCGRYFVSRSAYLDHFFSFYPSPREISSIPRPPGLPELGKIAGVISKWKSDIVNSTSVEDSALIPRQTLPAEKEDSSTADRDLGESERQSEQGDFERTKQESSESSDVEDSGVL